MLLLFWNLNIVSLCFYVATKHKNHTTTAEESDICLSNNEIQHSLNGLLGGAVQLWLKLSPTFAAVLKRLWICKIPLLSKRCPEELVLTASVMTATNAIHHIHLMGAHCLSHNCLNESQWNIKNVFLLCWYQFAAFCALLPYTHQCYWSRLNYLLHCDWSSVMRVRLQWYLYLSLPHVPHSL